MNSWIRSKVNVVWLSATIFLLGYWLLGASALSRKVLHATFTLGLAAGCVAVLLAIPLLVILRSSRNRQFWVVVLMALSSIPLYLQVGAWDSMVGRLGWLTPRWTDGFQLILSRWGMAIWIHGVAAAPQVALIMAVGERVGRGAFEEQGLLDADSQTVFWRVTLRRTAPFMLLGLVWVLIGCSREIAAADVYQIGTLAEYIYLGFALGQGLQMLVPWGEEATELGAGLQFVTIGWLGLSAFWFLSRMSVVDGDGTPISRSGPLQPSWLQRCAAVSTLSIIGLLPLANLILRGSLVVRRLDNQLLRVFDFGHFLKAIGRCWRDYQAEFGWSLCIGLLGATTACCLAWPLGYIAFRKPHLNCVVLGLSALGLAIPGPLIGLGVFQLMHLSSAEWVRYLFDRTALAPVLASVAFVLPMVLLMVWQVFCHLDRSVFSQAELDGATWSGLLARVAWRGYWPIWLGIWGLTSVLVMGELSSSQMVQIAGVDTLPRLTMGFLHSGVDDRTAAITFLTVVLVLFLSGVASLLVLRRRENG